MSDERKDLFRLMTGRTWDQTFRLPNAQQVVDELYEAIGSGFELRQIGWDTEGGPFDVSEEELESHTEVVGTTREGKSRYLQLLIRQNIDRGYGCCLLDPSDGGDTALGVLKYCASIGFEKVCYINPLDWVEDYKRVPSIQPIKHNTWPEVSIGNIKDALQVLWSAKDTDTPRIEKYIRAVILALYHSELTLAEVDLFADYHHLVDEREAVIKNIPQERVERKHLLRAFHNGNTFENHFQPTINRLNPLTDSALRLLLGSLKGAIPWQSMIREGWVVLVNLDPQPLWGTQQMQQRLLGTLIISEIVHAISRVNANGWEGRYYLYIDEVGDYATPKIAYILDKKAKTGLSLTIAHQRYDQIEDRNVRSSIQNSTKIKVAFYIPGRQDRDTAMKDLGYGGALPDRAVSYEMGQTPKQSAHIQVNKRHPKRVEILDVTDAEVTNEELRAFKQKIYSYPWFYSATEVENEINARFKETEPSPPISRKRPASSGAVESSSEQPGKGQDKGGGNARHRRTIPHHSPDSGTVLLSKKGRATRKINPLPPKEER